MNIDFKNLPYHHLNYHSNFESIMALGEKITFPQLIMEMVIFLRHKFIKGFPRIEMGKGWSNAVQRQVRGLVQQAHVLCNYFPHINDEPLVIYAFKKYFREQRPFRIGQYRKIRVSKKGTLTITQDEKDVVLGVMSEYLKALRVRESFALAGKTKEQLKEIKEEEKVAKPLGIPPQKGSLRYAIEMEKRLKELKNGQPNNDI